MNTYVMSCGQSIIHPPLFIRHFLCSLTCLSVLLSICQIAFFSSFFVLCKLNFFLSTLKPTLKKHLNATVSLYMVPLTFFLPVSLPYIVLCPFVPHVFPSCQANSSLSVFDPAGLCVCWAGSPAVGLLTRVTTEEFPFNPLPLSAAQASLAHWLNY